MAPPSTDVPRFVTMLKDEAAQRRIAVGAPSEANYRLHGYLAARTDNTRHRRRARHSFDHDLDRVDAGRL